MNKQEQATACNNGQRTESGNRKIRARHIAFAALVAAIAVVTTTLVMVAGSEPAHACLLPGIPC